MTSATEKTINDLERGSGWFVIDVREGMTDNEHSGGYALVRAASADAALRRLALTMPGKPDSALDVEKVEELPSDGVLIFPDVGCCG